ncbi:hypothetical protein BGZ80_011086, partial [Entomortierella chlamydospora]
MTIPKQWIASMNRISQEIGATASMDIDGNSSLESKSAESIKLPVDDTMDSLSDTRKAADVIHFSTEEISVFDRSVPHAPVTVGGVMEQEPTHSSKLKIWSDRKNGSPRTPEERVVPDYSDIINPERNDHKVVPIGERDRREVDYEFQVQIDYWRKALANIPVLLGLPTDRPRATQQSIAYSHLPIHFDVQLTQLLRSLARKHGVDLPVVLLSAWSAVLGRLTSQEDIVVGYYNFVIDPHVTCANRQNGNGDLPTSPLPLRMDLFGDPTTAQLLERVSQTILAARAHQDIAFENIVEIMRTSSKGDHAALFQVAFSCHDQEYGSGARKMAEMPSNSVTAGSELELHLQDKGGEIIGKMRYSAALFDSTTIERHVWYLSGMLKGM